MLNTAVMCAKLHTQDFIFFMTASTVDSVAAGGHHAMTKASFG